MERKGVAKLRQATIYSVDSFILLALARSYSHVYYWWDRGTYKSRASVFSGDWQGHSFVNSHRSTIRILEKKNLLMSDYGPLAKLLHRLALSSSALGEATFDIESKFVKENLKQTQYQQHIFVTGLARSGTTVLMRAFYDTGLFASLTYRDMPFILMPNAWAKYSRIGARYKIASDRAHADGVKVDFDSPEALEEVFWRVFHGSDYIKKGKLLPMQTQPEDEQRFRRYVSYILLRYGASRYLSKNNNNILRLGTLNSAFPNASILVPFRDPRQQANSLLTQHKHFLEMHKNDAFSKSYMNWLVHHEFGSDHRPFAWSENYSKNLHPLSLDYWVAQWVGVYGNIVKILDSQDSKNILPVGYELICEDTNNVWSKLTDKLDIKTNSTPSLTIRKNDTPPIISQNLIEAADKIFDRLNAECIRRLTLCNL